MESDGGLTFQRYTVHPPCYSGLGSPSGGTLDDHFWANHIELTLRLKHPLWRLWEDTSNEIIVIKLMRLQSQYQNMVTKESKSEQNNRSTRTVESHTIVPRMSHWCQLNSKFTPLLYYLIWKLCSFKTRFELCRPECIIAMFVCIRLCNILSYIFIRSNAAGMQESLPLVRLQSSVIVDVLGLRLLCIEWCILKYVTLPASTESFMFSLACVFL